MPCNLLSTHYLHTIAACLAATNNKAFPRNYLQVQIKIEACGSKSAASEP
jgi:hypothetical protein